MDVRQQLLDLAAANRQLSLVDAFEKLDAAVPTIFLTCRSLERTDLLDRVGPGTYTLTEHGQRELRTADIDLPEPPNRH